MAEVSSGRQYTLGDYQRLEEEHQERLLHRSADTSSIIGLSPQRKGGRRERIEEVHPHTTVLRDFSATMRCLEVTQGGMTLWSGDMDGTTSIRNGATGEIVHHIPSSDRLYVDSLFATDVHMWVGCSDGTVRIYDHLVYILVRETRPHQASVTAFAATFDGKLFSASMDGTVVKRDTEVNNFEVMCTVEALSPRALCCYGYYLFVGNEDGTIRCLDAETVQPVRTFTGHTGRITCLLVQDGYLFSGASDGTLSVWNMEHGECLRKLAEPDPVFAQVSQGITALTADPVGHTIWSADDIGRIRVWDSRPAAEFGLIDAYNDHCSANSSAASSVVQLKSVVTVDALKLWSMAANGKNRVWYAEVNRMEDAVQSTCEAMDTITNQDLVELAKWKELIRKLEARDERRKKELSSALCRTSDKGLMADTFHRLRRHLLVKRALKQRLRIADGRVVGNHEHVTMYQAYRYLQNNRNHMHKMRRRQRTVAYLTRQSHRGMMEIYWKKVLAFTKHRQRMDYKLTVAGYLGGRNSKAAMALWWRRFKLLSTKAARYRRHEKTAKALLSLTSQGMQRLIWATLRANVRRKRLQRRTLQFAEVIFGQTERFKRLMVFRRLRRIALQRRCRRLLACDCLSHHGSVLMSVYYHKLSLNRAERKDGRMHGLLLTERERHQRLSKQCEDREALLERIRALRAKEQLTSKKADELEQKRRRIEAKRLELERLQREHAAKLAAMEALHELSEIQKREMVASIMAHLKAKALNYVLDLPLIEKTRRICKQEGTSVKEFLRAHIAVKRVVVDVSKCQQEPGTRWKRMDKALGAIQDHHKLTILKEIKVMCIAYELMTEAQKEALETDDEIIANDDGRDGQTRYLSEMVDIGRALEEKRRGRA